MEIIEYINDKCFFSHNKLEENRIALISQEEDEKVALQPKSKTIFTTSKEGRGLSKVSKRKINLIIKGTNPESTRRTHEET